MSDDMQKQIFAENLNKLLEQYDLTQREFADAIKEKISTVNSQCTATVMPRITRIQKIADFFHIRKSDLLEKMSEQTLDSLDEHELLKDYRKLNKDGKSQIKVQLKNLTRIPSYLKTSNSDELYLAAAHGSEGMNDDELALLQEDIKDILEEDD